MENISGSLILVRGLSGSGKTSAAHLFAKEGDWPVCSNDDWFERLPEYKFNWKDWESAKALCYNKTHEHMNSGVQKIYVTNTFSEEDQLSPYFDLAKKHNYRVFSVIVENRHGNKNIHNVPDGVVEKMKTNFSVCLN